MIDSATSCSEMSQITNKTATEITDIAKKTWFTCYPLPQRIVFDRGTKFMDEFSKMCHNDYGLKRKHINGENNVVADALSRLEMSDNQEILNISELYG